MKWWLENNLRMIQNNLRDTDAGMDVEKWFEEIRLSHCNCVMVGMGGSSYGIQVAEFGFLLFKNVVVAFQMLLACLGFGLSSLH